MSSPSFTEGPPAKGGLTLKEKSKAALAALALAVAAFLGASKLRPKANPNGELHDSIGLDTGDTVPDVCFHLIRPAAGLVATRSGRHGSSNTADDAGSSGGRASKHCSNRPHDHDGRARAGQDSLGLRQSQPRKRHLHVLSPRKDPRHL